MKAHLNYTPSVHPLLEPKAVYLETTAYSRLVDTLTEWLWEAATGGFLLGEPRAGKSWAVRALTNQLKLRDGRTVPVFYMSMAERDQKTIAEISRLGCIEHELPYRPADTADVLTKAFLSHVSDRQVEAGVRTSVLIVDECDLLAPRQFHPFAELFNRLDKLHRSITIVFVGSKEESMELLGNMIGTKYKRIRGRFFKRFSEFYGIRSREELTELMRQYDTLRYPDKGPTYTAAFLPESVNAGWRLAGLAKDLWRIYAEIARDCQLDSWGMEFVVGTLNVLVTDLLPHYGWDRVEDDLLREAILMTHVADNFVHALPVKKSK